MDMGVPSEDKSKCGMNISDSVQSEDTDHDILPPRLQYQCCQYLSNQMKDENKTASVHSSLTPSSPHHTTVGLVGKFIAVLHLLHYRDIVKLNHLSAYACRKQKHDSPRCCIHEVFMHNSICMASRIYCMHSDEVHCCPFE